MYSGFLGERGSNTVLARMLLANDCCTQVVPARQNPVTSTTGAGGQMRAHARSSARAAAFAARVFTPRSPGATKSGGHDCRRQALASPWARCPINQLAPPRTRPTRDAARPCLCALCKRPFKVLTSVSVVVLAYNAARSIGVAITSVLRQSLCDLEPAFPRSGSAATRNPAPPPKRGQSKHASGSGSQLGTATKSQPAVLAAIAGLNAKHFVVTLAGQTVIATTIQHDALQRELLVFS